MNIYVLNTLGIGEDSVEIISHEIKIKGIIGLSKRDRTDKISDYSFQGHFSKKMGIQFVEVSSYTLSDERDKEKLLNLDIDVLIISGWQRLIPDWLIQHCSICAIGSHGSPLGITKGRGRSPQNWALIMGMESFEISIFQVDKGIDSGRIFASKKFNYSTFDNIQTSYYKVCMLTSRMIIDLLKTPNFMQIEYQQQMEDDAEYFPQRTADDGRIDWNRSNNEIRNHIRALTKPYPGAISSFEGNTIKVWDAIPFDIDIPIEKYRIGEIVKIFNKRDILVRTKESLLLVIDYDLDVNSIELKSGLILESVNYNNQMKAIIDRHQNKYSDLTISTVIKTFANKV